MFKRFISNNNDLFLVGGMIGILMILFAPIPTALLDFLIILNFSFALTILMHFRLCSWWRHCFVWRST
jgi:flagellar biosynthesis protein FlhA